MDSFEHAAMFILIAIGGEDGMQQWCFNGDVIVAIASATSTMRRSIAACGYIIIHLWSCLDTCGWRGKAAAQNLGSRVTFIHKSHINHFCAVRPPRFCSLL